METTSTAVSKAEVEAIKVASFDEFFNTFKAQEKTIIARAEKIRSEIESDLGIKLPNNLACDTFAYHLRFIQNNKTGYEEFLSRQNEKKDALIGKAESNLLPRTIVADFTDSRRGIGNRFLRPQESEFDVYARSTADAMVEEYLTLFFWPHFRMKALQNHYETEAVSSKAITAEELAKTRNTISQKIERAAAIKLGNKPLLPPLFTSKSKNPNHTATQRAFESTIQPVYESHTLANSLLFFLEGDLHYVKDRALAYDPRYPIIGRGKHSDIMHDFAHDHGWDYAPESHVSLSRFDLAGTRESYSVEHNMNVPVVKFGVSAEDAEKLIRYFELEDKPEEPLRKSIESARDATATIKSLMLKLRIGLPVKPFELGKANSQLQTSGQELIQKLQQVDNNDPAKALPSTLLGHHLIDGKRYESEYSVQAQFSHLMMEIKSMVSNSRQL